MKFWFPVYGILSILIIRSESDTEEKILSIFRKIFNFADREQAFLAGTKPAVVWHLRQPTMTVAVGERRNVYLLL